MEGYFVKKNNSHSLTRIEMQTHRVSRVNTFIIGAETRPGYYVIRYEVNMKDVAGTINTPRILIITAFGYQGAGRRASIEYFHVVIRTFTRAISMLEIKMFKVQINEVTRCHRNCPVASHAERVVVWIVWAGEVSSQTS